MVAVEGEDGKWGVYEDEQEDVAEKQADVLENEDEEERVEDMEVKVDEDVMRVFGLEAGVGIVVVVVVVDVGFLRLLWRLLECGV